MRTLLRSTIRIAVASTLGLLLVFGVLAALLTQPVLGRLPDRLVDRADPDLLEEHVRFLTVDAHPRDSAHPANLDLAADYIEQRFSTSNARVSRQTYTAQGNTYSNVIASFGPVDGPRVIVGAHYDSFGLFGDNPGADDNASGTAGLLELARLLDKADVKTRVDLVAFSTEEPPHFAMPTMGSAVHAASLADEDVEVAAMICLEMIGYFPERQPWPNWLFRALYPDTGDFVMIVGRYADRKLLRRSKKAFRGASRLDVHAFAAPAEDAVPAIDASDHRSYWKQGFHAVMVTDTATVRNENYHSEHDTLETLDFEKMALVVDGVANMALALDGEG